MNDSISLKFQGRTWLFLSEYSYHIRLLILSKKDSREKKIGELFQCLK